LLLLLPHEVNDSVLELAVELCWWWCASVPGEPRRVRLEAVNSTAVHVQWRPPLEREQNGVIRGYQVLFMRIDDRHEGIGDTRVYDVMDG